ncbi:SPOSA6832_04609 [Sporobolomyces salmonicolor]|uniref:SPOSA6832_04609-mRNA-1:cds n=1 Tax=Sporidiobolus salmonicolor TaxID=5005 RepID=A0A0D6ERM9_SPOSA|nr:SPOSA6832_04609 [Sporobolomyces salmonicolor]
MAASAVPAPRDASTIRSELAQARARIAQLEAELAALSPASAPANASSDASAPVPVTANDSATKRKERAWPLSVREYKRYGRQMLLSSVGLPGQLKLKKAHVLVVGAGGLGCPVLLYLAAAGVGEITILDHDTVELSNLHRQVLHTEGRVGMSKAESARIGLQACIPSPRPPFFRVALTRVSRPGRLNSDILIHAHPLAFTPSLFHTPSAPLCLLRASPSPFTLILDCTDNPATRHFLNAYAVAVGVPLVSGGAVRAEGTVGVYGLPLRGAADERGPCYACIFPSAPPPAPTTGETHTLSHLEADLAAERASLAGTGACADEGVLGILCGVVGLGMAAEAVKVLLGAGESRFPSSSVQSMHHLTRLEGTAQPTLQLFAPLSPTPYRTIKTRPRKPTCPSCGTLPSSSLSSSTPSCPSPSTPESRWSAFLCSASQTWPGWVDPLCALPGVGELAAKQGRHDTRIKVDELRGLLERRARVVDTRPEAEFGIASVEGSVNIPFARLLKDPSLALSAPSTPVEGSAAPLSTLTTPPRGLAEPAQPIVFICRRGNDSLLASRALRRWLAENQDGERQGRVKVVDVVGGLNAWANEEAGEKGFPVY